MAQVPGPGGVPTITVITVCYDAETYIEQTIQSVIAQSYPEIEYIIVDGASTDGTLGIIEKYGEKIAKRISEPDQGIADGMNKG
ncbi:MAG: glycosyltransferase, partial [Proteobacteria bacterium]|nr:glycosyltransferase [Pseudomonadota bacterium]